MPTIHLQVCAGFANRLRALVSGICFAEEVNMPLVIHWFPLSPECRCPLEALLDLESLPKFVKVVREDLFGAKEVLSYEDLRYTIDQWDLQSDFVIKSHGKFYCQNPERWLHYLRTIKPSRFIRNQLEKRFASLHWPSSVGVHIRRGDHKKSILHSPTELFIDRLRQEGAVFFVVATDSSAVKTELSVAFPGTCIFPSQELSRSTEKGMIEAGVDFFALASCPRIYGSFASSFSEMAAAYGNAELIVLSKDS